MSALANLEGRAREVGVIASLLNREQRRRALAREYQSLVMRPRHPLGNLMKPHRYKVLYGGRGSAKSWSVAEALVRYCDAPLGKYMNVPERILCTREYQTSIKDSVHQLLKDTIDRMGLSHRFYATDRAIRNTVTGGSFIFKGLHHDPNGVKSTEGLTRCWVEEAQSTTSDSWQILIPTVRMENSEFFVTFNTTDEQAPTFVRFVPEENRPDDAFVQLINFDQNPFFPEVLRREMEFLRKNDYEAYLHVWEGLPKKISDAIIFLKKVKVMAFSETLYKEAKRLHFGADFGFARDPSTLIRFFIIENTLYIEYEAYGVGVELNEMDEFYRSVPGAKESGFTVKGDNARPETISYMKGKGYRMEAAEKWKGSVEDGIAHIKAFDEIIIHERCKHVAQEARLYSYKTDKISGEVLPIIVDKHNHCWDAIRYGLDGYIQRRGGLGVWDKLGRQ